MLKKNQIHTAEITGYTADGAGVCRIEGRAVFVKGTIIGEIWEVRILKVTSSAVYGKGERCLSPSAMRQDPPCPVYRKCGGCSLLHMTYAEELNMKRARVNDALRHIGGLSFQVSDILGADQPEHYRNKANLGNDWGRSHESILHFRKSASTTLNVDDIRIPYGAHTLKYPARAQSGKTSAFAKSAAKRSEEWVPNPLGAKPKDVFDIPTTCNGMGEKTPHPTQKPEELLRKIVLASSKPGDWVLDPFSGSGTTLVAAEQLGRRWLGCDLSEEYNGWAAARLRSVPERDVSYWIAFDRETAERRESIR